MSRHRLFRRRTRWDIVKDNLHVGVTAAALIAAAFAWNAMSNAEESPTQFASSDLTVTPSAEASPSPSVEEATPPPPEPAALMRSSEQAAPPPQAQPIIPARAQPARVADVSSQMTRPAPQIESSKIQPERRATRTQRAHQAHPRIASRDQRRATTASASTNRRSAVRRSRNQSGLDPFDCRVRKKQPCFNASSTTVSAQR
jgi:hypothetical protein